MTRIHPSGCKGCSQKISLMASSGVRVSGQRLAARRSQLPARDPAVREGSPPFTQRSGTLWLVAQYANACNLFAYGGAGTIRHKLEVLRRHCEDVGRNYEEIERTALGSVNLGAEGIGPDEVIEMCEDLGEAGIEHVIINMPNVHEISPLETLGQKVIPAVAEL
jgi:hypothetical protein